MDELGIREGVRTTRQALLKLERHVDEEIDRLRIKLDELGFTKKCITEALSGTEDVSNSMARIVHSVD
jgi:hypothetical protein